jgi:glycosyltransferase involved in cell wall biosynthesis
MTPAVTVAIAFHDEERWLGDAVRSILRQPFADFELLLLDDGSSDRSVEVARGFVGDARVSVAKDGARKHLAARLNEALGRARGRFFARMDADDVSAPERLVRQVAHLARNEGTVAVGTWAGLVDDAGAPFGVVEAEPHGRTTRSLLVRGAIPHATMLARTDWLRGLGYDESLTRAEDLDLWRRAGPTCRIDVVPEVLYVIRVLARRPGFLADYLAGQADLRALVRRHGPASAGLPTTARLIASSFAKSQVMRLATAAGAAPRLVRRRGRAPTLDEQARIAAALAAAREDQTP